jgi:glycerophosphoryl diester phosphodiesterase
MKKLFTIFFILYSMTTTAQYIDIQGHRGCRGLMPENTLEAFAEALKHGVTTLELDVCISRDRKVVVSHEPYMSSQYCSWPSGKAVSKADEKTLNLYLMPYKEIKKFDTGSRGNGLFPEQKKLKTYKPLLEEVLKKIDKQLKTNNLSSVNYNIELKSEAAEYRISQPEVAEFCDLVYAVLKKNIAFGRVTIQSFDFEILKYWHQKTEEKTYQKVQLAALVEDKDRLNVTALLGFKPDVFSPYYKFLDKKAVADYQAQGIKVIPWTVNTPADLLLIYNLGVDGIITDYPNRWQQLNNKK